ncbi:MAG: hypothetical protein KKA06_06365, partial [Nanoarchaeota archaeon]|nr:hypothetical protein [Nanoarchaeota archaeon]
SSCTYCSNTCTQITLYGPKCGDGTCNNGETYNTCPTDCPPSSCTFNEQTITHEQSTTAYQTSNVSFGQNCNSQTRTCNNGVLSGTYQYQSCTVGPAPSCNLPWGGTTPHNTNVTAYQTSSVSLGQNCNSQTRNCNAGTLSGSYTYQTCSVQGSPSCNLPWGGSIPHGDSTTAYLTNSVACGQTCNSQTRNCNNGALSGSYTQQICNVALCPGKCNKDSDCLRISLDDIYTPLCVDGNCTCLYDKQGIYYHPTLGCTRERNPCVTEKMSRLKSNMDAEAIHSRYLYDDGSTYCWKNCGSRGWVIDCAEPVTWFDNRPV